MIYRRAIPRDYAGALVVFWQTASTTDFPDEAAREEFLFKYFGYYREYARGLFHVAVDEEGVAGYICGVADTRAHQTLYPISPHLLLFDDLFDEFPAHLHINVHERTRGRGVGAALIGVLEDALRSRAGAQTRPAGLHLVTDAASRNVSFYRRNGFLHTVQRDFEYEGRSYPLLFMGKLL